MPVDDKKQKAIEKAKEVRARKLKEAGKSSTASNKIPGTKTSSTSKNYYDVYSPETIEAAKKAGYDLKFLEEDVKYDAEKQGYGIGHQKEFDPESGFYYDKSRSKPPGKKGLENYMKLHSDIIDQYVSDDGATGAEAWKRDHLRDANKKTSLGEYARDDKAIKFLVDNRNKQYKEATGKDLIDFTKKNAYVPGVQLFNLPNISKTKQEEKVEQKIEEKKDETPVTKTEEKREPIERNPVRTRVVEENAPWWLQDIVGVAGAFGDLNRINRYMPWQATPNVHLPGATFYDPTRELGANAEQANIQTQGLAAFTGPQALSARSSQIQGQALKNAADIMGRYNNLNVGLANELEQNRAQILNAASQNQANLDTQLWDKYTIMNQQFDNSKAQARQELRKQYINAITNRAKAQALNSLYDNYHTDPGSGGMIDFIDTGYTPTPTQSSADDDIAQAKKLVKELGIPIEKALEHVRLTKSPKGGGSYDSEYIANQGYQ